MKNKVLKSLFALSLAVVMAATSVTANAATMAVENGVADFGRPHWKSRELAWAD